MLIGITKHNHWSHTERFQYTKYNTIQRNTTQYKTQINVQVDRSHTLGWRSLSITIQISDSFVTSFFKYPMSGSVRSINDPTYFQSVTDFFYIRGGNVKFCGLYSVSFFILRILHFSCPTKVPFLDPVKNLRGLPFYILQHPNLLIYSTQTVYKAVVEIHNTWNTLALNSNTNIIQTLNTNNTTHNANVQRAG